MEFRVLRGVFERCLDRFLRGVFANRAVACVDQGVDGLAGWSVACRGVEHLQIFISFTAGVTISYSIAGPTMLVLLFPSPLLLLLFPIQ